MNISSKKQTNILINIFNSAFTDQCLHVFTCAQPEQAETMWSCISFGLFFDRCFPPSSTVIAMPISASQRRWSLQLSWRIIPASLPTQDVSNKSQYLTVEMKNSISFQMPDLNG